VFSSSRTATAATGFQDAGSSGDIHGVIYGVGTEFGSWISGDDSNPSTICMRCRSAVDYLALIKIASIRILPRAYESTP